MTEPGSSSNSSSALDAADDKEAGSGAAQQPQSLELRSGGAWISIRIKGDSERCDRCGREIEVFGSQAAKARFLIVRDADQLSLGGGRCLDCGSYVCLHCATKTIYGQDTYRLHCPQCGAFLSGLRRTADDGPDGMGALLQEPDFAGREESEPSASEG